MQTFCTDTTLGLRSSCRASHRTSWQKKTPSLHPLLPPQCWPKEKPGREVVPKWLSITDKGNVSSDCSTLSSDQTSSDFSVLKSREIASLTVAGLLGLPSPEPHLPSFSRRPTAVVTPFHTLQVHLEPGASCLARGRGTKVSWDISIVRSLLRSVPGWKCPRKGVRSQGQRMETLVYLKRNFLRGKK